MQLPDVVKGMCQIAELDLKEVPMIRFRKGTGKQDIYVELESEE
jgi:hypothetical protein